MDNNQNVSIVIKEENKTVAKQTSIDSAGPTVVVSSRMSEQSQW